MEKGKALLRDLGKAILCGLLIGAGLALLLLGGGALFTGGNLYLAMEAVRSGLLVVGSLGFLLVAGMLLVQRSPLKMEHQASWKKQFRLLPFGAVVVAVCAVLLCCGAVADFIVRAIR